MFKYWHETFGALRDTGERWIGAKNVRYGRFFTRNGASVNLPVKEVRLI